MYFVVGHRERVGLIFLHLNLSTTILPVYFTHIITTIKGRLNTQPSLSWHRSVKQCSLNVNSIFIVQLVFVIVLDLVCQWHVAVQGGQVHVGCWLTELVLTPMIASKQFSLTLYAQTGDGSCIIKIRLEICIFIQPPVKWHTWSK